MVNRKHIEMITSEVRIVGVVKNNRKHMEVGSKGRGDSINAKEDRDWDVLGKSSPESMNLIFDNEDREGLVLRPSKQSLGGSKAGKQNIVGKILALTEFGPLV